MAHTAPTTETYARHRAGSVPRAAVLALAGALLLASCGGGSGSGSAAAAAAATSPSSATAGRPADNRPPFPGVSGLIAAISGQTLQVQSATTQTAVTYTARTTFTDTRAASPKDVVVGECVVVRPGGAASTPTMRPSPPSEITAGTVTLSPPVNGDCGPGVGAALGFGTRFRAPNDDLRSAAPGRGGTAGRARPSGPAARGRGQAGIGGFGASGRISAVHGSTFVVTRAARVAPISGTTAAPTTPRPAPTASNVPATTITVTTTPATTYTETVAATPAALATGRCAVAVGPADDTGAVTANSISVRDAVDGSCTPTFGRRGGGAPAAVGGASGG